jgi:hypothetical protein
MYEYWRSEPQLFTVGTRGPDGAILATDSDHETREGAANRVIELNGGGNTKPLRDALMVMVTNPQISAYLRANDPMALNQARKALGILPLEDGIAPGPDRVEMDVTRIPGDRYQLEHGAKSHILTRGGLMRRMNDLAAGRWYGRDKNTPCLVRIHRPRKDLYFAIESVGEGALTFGGRPGQKPQTSYLELNAVPCDPWTAEVHNEP